MRCIPVGIGFFHLQLRQQDYHDYHHNQREPQVQEIKHIDAGLGLYRRICHVAAGRKKPSCQGCPDAAADLDSQGRAGKHGAVHTFSLVR